MSTLSSGKIVNINILWVDKYYSLLLYKFTYYSLGKALENQTKKKSLNHSNNIDELKQIESISPKWQLNYLIIDKLKGIM